MTNVRRPIHLQLRAGAALEPNGAVPPFSLNSPTAASSPAAPIRPNALMNFSSSILTATPTTRVREPALGRQAAQRRRDQQRAALNLPLKLVSASGQSAKALSPSGSVNDSLPSQILPHLYVGDLEQTNRETVNKLNIRYILSLGLLPQLLQNSNYTASIISPGSPLRKPTPMGSPTSATSVLPMESGANQASKTSSTNGTSSATKVAASIAATHPAHLTAQQQEYLSQQQKILMPGRDSSRDFKIRLRSSTPSGTGATLSASQLVIKPAAASGTLVGLTQQATSSPTDPYHRQAFLGAAAGAANQDRSINSAAKTPASTTPSSLAPSATSTPPNSGGELDEENKGVKQVRSIHCKCINIMDRSDQSLLKFFDEAFAFIDEARRKKCNILVHCLAGISRSPTFAIGYLMRVESLGWREAYDLVRQSRPQIDPNLNFMGQLQLYQKTLRKEEKELDERVNH